MHCACLGLSVGGVHFWGYLWGVCKCMVGFNCQFGHLFVPESITVKLNKVITKDDPNVFLLHASRVKDRKRFDQDPNLAIIGTEFTLHFSIASQEIKCGES